MALPNSSFSDIIATTLQGYSGVLADNITKHHPLLNKLNDRGNIEVATGRSIVQEIEYAENATAQWYSGYEILSTTPTDTFTAAEYQYKQLAGNVTISGLEQVQNSGKEAIHNLVKSRVKNLERTLKNTTATGLFATGTGNSGKEIGGLQLLVADAGTGTVGGIDSSTYTWWKNKYVSTTSAVSSTNIQGRMNRLWIQLIRGTDSPDMIVSDALHFNAYLASLQAQQRFTSDKDAAAGFKSLAFMDGTPVFYDALCPTKHMYFLNTSFLFFRPAKGRNFVPLPEKASVNQDALVMPMVWAGNMTCSNRSLQGVLLHS